MKLNLRDALASIDYHELVDIHKDLVEGGHGLRQQVKDEIIKKERELGKLCHVCQSEIDPNSTHNYTLLLGPEGLRRKASFCALDCLKYFLSETEKQKEELKSRRLVDNADQ